MSTIIDLLFWVGYVLTVAIVSYVLFVTPITFILGKIMKKRKPPVEPTPAQIASACMSFDHGFGLLSKEEQAQMMRDAREWKIAWDKEDE